MRNQIYKILWLTILISTLIFIFFIYKSFTTKYDENIGFLFLAFLTSLLTSIILIYLACVDRTKNYIKKSIKIGSLLFGTPITLIFLFIYTNIFRMNAESTLNSIDSNNSYELEKSRNYFKSKNILIRKDLLKKTDTTVAIVSKNGSIEQLYKIKNGKIVNLKQNKLDYLTKEQKKELTTF